MLAKEPYRQMDNRNEAADRKRQPEGANPPANKRSKSSETVSADVQRASNKTAQQPTKIHYTRLRRRMDEEEEEKLAKLGPQPNDGTTKLTDVNVDCLEHIFKNLSLIDLLNVADSNKQLKPAADLVFASRYGKQWIFIHSRYKSILIFERNMYPPTVQIRRSFRLKLLRCFGHLITKLDITHDKHMDAYVNEYCAESLVEIKFQRCKASTLDDLKKPFTQVKTLCFDSCKLGSKLSELDKWFPKMRRLEFTGANKVSDSSETAVHFPHLQHLTLSLPIDTNSRLNNLSELLRLYLNTRSLSIIGYFEVKYLQSVSEHLQHLERLEINPFGYFSNVGNDTVHFPNVKKLKLRDIAHAFPLTFDKLEELDVVWLAMDQALDREEGVLSKIASPALVEVDLGGHACIPSDEVVSFVAECTSLKKLSLAFDNEDDYEAVLDRLCNEWRVTEKGGGYIDKVTMER